MCVDGQLLQNARSCKMNLEAAARSFLPQNVPPCPKMDGLRHKYPSLDACIDRGFRRHACKASIFDYLFHRACTLSYGHEHMDVT